MFQRIIAVVLLLCMAVMNFGCYTLKPFPPEQVKPDWEIAYVVKKDSTVIRFDDEDQGSIQGKLVVGGVRNEFSEIRPYRVPLDSVSVLRVRRLDTSTRALIVAGLGVGIVTFLVVEVLSQHRSKSGKSGPPSPDNGQ